MFLQDPTFLWWLNNLLFATCLTNMVILVVLGRAVRRYHRINQMLLDISLRTWILRKVLPQVFVPDGYVAKVEVVRREAITQGHVWED